MEKAPVAVGDSSAEKMESRRAEIVHTFGKEPHELSPEEIAQVRRGTIQDLRSQKEYTPDKETFRDLLNDIQNKPAAEDESVLEKTHEDERTGKKDENSKETVEMRKSTIQEVRDQLHLGEKEIFRNAVNSEVAKETSGVTKETLDKKDVCGNCHGTGRGWFWFSCRTCKGSGRKTPNQPKKS